MKKLAIRMTAILIGLLVICPSAWAGWTVLEKDGQKHFISQSRIKTVPQDASEGWSLMDFKKGQMLVVDTENDVYAQASFDQFCQSMQKLAAKVRSMFEQEKQKPKPVKVEVKNSGSGGKIAGYDTVKYKVMVDGKLREEVWISSGVEFIREFSPSMMTKLMGCAAQEYDLENSAAYQKMMSSGWLMRAVDYESGVPEVQSEVVQISKQEIPESGFQVPKGFEKIHMEAMIMEQ